MNDIKYVLEHNKKHGAFHIQTAKARGMLSDEFKQFWTVIFTGSYDATLEHYSCRCHHVRRAI